MAEIRDRSILVDGDIDAVLDELLPLLAKKEA